MSEIWLPPRPGPKPEPDPTDGGPPASEWAPPAAGGAPAPTSTDRTQAAPDQTPTPAGAWAPPAPAHPGAPAGDGVRAWAPPEPSAGAPAPAPRRRRRRAGPVLLAIAALLAAAAVAAIALALLGSGAGTKGARLATAPAPHPPRRRPAGSAATELHPLRVPFSVHGIRLAAFVDPNEPWAAAARARTPAAARPALVLVAVLTRNLGHAGFDPYAVNFRLDDGAGAQYAPDRALGTAAQLGRPHPLPVGGIDHVHLGFMVPPSATGLVLRMGHLDRTGVAVGVPLGR